MVTATCARVHKQPVLLRTLFAVPTYGGGHDLYIVNNANSNEGSSTNFPHSYQDVLGYRDKTFTGSRHFKVDNIEIFAIR